ncbi:MAG: hypothetical protein RLZZ543_410 [Bacteroidota bacterium]|jgi:ADP-heptose:LPS heptosyltransferase
MRTRIQLLLDKTIGSVLNLFLYGFVRLLGMLLRINHQLDRDIKRIVVCKFKGMGSIVQASALLATLRKNHPKADIRFVSTKANAGILKFYSAEINEVILVDDSSFFRLLSSTLKSLFSLWRFRPQVYIDLEIYSNFSTLLCTLSAATNRLGFYKSDKDYRTGLFTHLMYYNIKAPLSEIYLQMSRILGNKDEVRELIRPIITAEMHQNVKQQFPMLASEQFVVINPNASDLRLERRWPAASFVALIQSIRKQHPERIVALVGNKQEATYVNEIAKEFESDTNVINTSGKLRLNELMALVENAAVVVTNDTGPLHLSLALRKATVGLFGPCSPHQYGQMEYCYPVYQNVYCSPCVHEFMTPPCAGDNQCMKQIEVAQVMIALNQQLANGGIDSIHQDLTYTSFQKALGFVYNR